MTIFKFTFHLKAISLVVISAIDTDITFGGVVFLAHQMNGIGRTNAKWNAEFPTILTLVGYLSLFRRC